ncbi:kelch-like protein 11 [Echeneis naucrates]|uniref:Kelch-like protein 11 n=1 Tax=Echeneis naucrates TaxID=173247 RepID=A0A665TQ75_ECHNA|nr:kelch-like protein 11 [Echeneis naucrates]
MSVLDCLFTCVVYAYELLPRISQSFHAPVRLASSCGMAAADGPEDGCRSGGAQGAVTGDREPEEAEEFTCPAYCSELSRRQNEQRKAGLFCDLTLVFRSGGPSGESVQTLSAHRSVLSAASQYFALLLGGHFSESLSGRVELKEWSSETGPDPDTVSGVIQFMYTGEIRVTTANVHDVLELADRFLLAQLKCFCGEFLMKKLTLSNCVAVHSLAHMYTLDQLAVGAAETIRRNFHKVIRKEEFHTLPFHLVRDWLSDSEITVDSEQELFETIVKWVHQNIKEREKHFVELFSLLRLPQIAPTILTRVVRKEPLVVNSAPCQKLVSDTLELQAVHFESLKLAGDVELHDSCTAAIQPRFGQNMDVIMVVGGVSEAGEYLSECVGYFVAEDRWVNLPHIHNHLDGHAIAVTDSHVYVAGSMEPGFAKMAERYNPNLNIWEHVSSLASRKHSFSLIHVKDILYSIGGHGNFSPGFKDVTIYEPEHDEWQNLEPAPKILRDVKTVSVEDRYVYVMARTPVDMDSGDGLSTVTICYDTKSHKWKDVDSLPLIDNYCQFQMAVASTNFYHTASCCPKNYKITVEAAQQKISRNISDDILDSLPPEVLGMEGAAICYLGEDIFIIGGWRNNNNMDKQYRKEAYRYCTERKRWMLLPPLPQPRCRAAACHVRIPYHYLYGCQRYPMPQNLARQRDRMQQMQQLHRRTLTLRRQLQSQIEC